MKFYKNPRMRGIASHDSCARALMMERGREPVHSQFGRNCSVGSCSHPSLGSTIRGVGVTALSVVVLTSAWVVEVEE